MTFTKKRQLEEVEENEDIVGPSQVKKRTPKKKKTLKKKTPVKKKQKKAAAAPETSVVRSLKTF